MKLCHPGRDQEVRAAHITHQAIQRTSRARKSCPLSPQTLHIQQRLAGWTKSGRKHWDLCRHLLSVHLLADATKLVLGNAGSYGIDKVTCDAVKAEGLEFVRKLRKKLATKTYRPVAVRRVYIPKRDGKRRPLGIPTVEDRVVQRALALLFEAIYEQILLPCSYGFRPGRSAPECVFDLATKVYSHRFVVDADIEDFFGSVSHTKLLGMLKEQIVDRRVMSLIGQILRAGYFEKQAWQPTPQGNLYVRFGEGCGSRPKMATSAPTLSISDDDKPYWDSDSLGTRKAAIIAVLTRNTDALRIS